MQKGRKPGRRRRQGFLDCLRKGLSVAAAAEAIGVDRSTPFNWRQKDPAYAAAWQAAVEHGTDRLEDVAMRRGVKGVRQPVFHAGKRVGYIVRYSDRLLLALLRARRPRKFRDFGSRHDNDDASTLAARLEAARKRIAK